MKLTVSRKELYEGLQIVTRAVSSTTTMPVLRNVLLEPGTDSIKLTATDLDLGLEALIPARIDEPGSITVPARTLTEIVAALPDAEICLGADDPGTLLLTCRRSQYRILGIGAEEFPALPEVSGDVAFTVTQSRFRTALRQTVFAASTEEARFQLTGVFLRLEGNQLRLVATDSHRLAIRDLEVSEAAGEASVIVPRRAMHELERILAADSEEPLFVRLGQNQALFRTSTVTLTTRLIEGQFPAYERVIPSRWSRRLTLPRVEFEAVVRRARIVARSSASGPNRVVLATHGESLVVTAEAGDVGTAREEIEVVREGDEIEIAFNPDYLLDVAEVSPGEGLYLEMNEPLSPAVMRPVEDASYQVIIMPMQLL